MSLFFSVMPMWISLLASEKKSRSMSEVDRWLYWGRGIGGVDLESLIRRVSWVLELRFSEE